MGADIYTSTILMVYFNIDNGNIVRGESSDLYREDHYVIELSYDGCYYPEDSDELISAMIPLTIYANNRFTIESVGMLHDIYYVDELKRWVEIDFKECNRGKTWDDITKISIVERVVV